MARTRAAVALALIGAVALVVVSGGSDADPRTPAGLPGMPPPFLGTAVAGSGELTAAVDAYGNVVDLRAPGPAGRALIENTADRQAAGTVSADTGIVPRVSIDGGLPRAFWRADSVSQRYLHRTNVVRTVARFGRIRAELTAAAASGALAETLAVTGPSGESTAPTLGANLIGGSGIRCEQDRRPGEVAIVCSAGASVLDAGSNPVTNAADEIIRASAATGRAWIARAHSLGPAAPAWARRMYARSLLTLRALTDRRSGAVAAGARDGWAYVWPRDAGTAALAFAAAGYRPEARRIARFLLRLDLGAAARFDGDGDPVPGRAAQGDAAGWVVLAARAAGLPLPKATPSWRDRPDYQEGAPGDYLANAIANAAVDGPKTPLYRRKSSRPPGAARLVAAFGSARGLVRRAEDPGSGLDSAAAWAVRPFPQPALFPLVRRSLLRLARVQTRFGIIPSEKWSGGVDPWSAPTAWTAWSLAALAGSERSAVLARDERRQALRVLADLRRASTPAGEIPERVDAGTGVPRSTTPLAWSHAFAILALLHLWPPTGGV